MNLQAALNDAQQRLTQAGVDNPSLDARLLVAHALVLERIDLLMQSARELNESEVMAIAALIARREGREPVGRILGLREFWGLPFALNEATLEPRPDSETLVEVALKLQGLARAAATPPPTPPARGGENEALRVLDLGTGTGCLLLSLLHEWPQAVGLGIDQAPRAVQAAQENAARLGLDQRARFAVGDWLAGVTDRFDVIVSNPPYIPSQEIARLAPEVRCFDPLAALDGGADGLTPYHHLIPLLPAFLTSHGLVLFEVGLGQAEAVAAMMRENAFVAVAIHPDLGGVSRCVCGTIGRER